MTANCKGSMAKARHIDGIASEIKKVCPGAEKNILEIEKMKNDEVDFNKK